MIILATVSAIAIPRMMQGAENAAEIGVMQNTAILNRALDAYWVDHGHWPTKDDVHEQLTMFSDRAGKTFKNSPDPGSGIIYGPYVAKAPPLAVGPNAGATRIADAAANDVGWLYSVRFRRIVPNLFNGGGVIPADLADLADDAGVTNVAEAAGGATAP